MRTEPGQNPDTQKPLTPKQRAAIEALLTTESVTEAATAAGVRRQSIHEWLRTDARFRAALREAEHVVLDSVTRRALVLADRALDAVRDALDDPERPGTSARLRAAGMLLDTTLKLREAITIEERVAALEASLAAAEEAKGH